MTIDAPDRVQRYVEADGRIRRCLVGAEPGRPAIVATAFSCAASEDDEPALSRHVADEAARIATELLLHFGMPNSALLQLGQSFAERWSFESKPLLDVLHSDLGRQFERLAADGEASRSRDYAQYDRYVLNEVLASIKAGHRDTRLTWRAIRSALPAQAESRDRLVSAIFGVMRTEDAVQLSWQGMEVATGTALLSRFEADDDTLHRRVASWLDSHADLRADDVVVAEIVYLPHPTLGNVIRRPVRTSHAIYLSPCQSATGPQPIHLATLRVRWRNDRLELWCSSLRKRVILVMNNAHYHQGSQHLVYRFLGALATQELTRAQLRIPDSVRDLRHCPRILVDGTIFKSQAWTLELAEDARPRRDSRALRDHLRAIGVPRWFTWSQLDRAVLVDADNYADLHSLQAAMRGVDRLQLMEVITGHEGGVAHEIVLPLRMRSRSPSGGAALPVLPLCTEERKFLPGSEYVYVQLFTDAPRLDRLPQEIFSRLRGHAGHAQRRPFFLKYAVPAPHLRFRLHARDQPTRRRLLQQILELADALVFEGWIDHIALATYEPEVERYGGGDLWQHSEVCFSADSSFSCRLSACIDDEGLEDDAVVFAMAMSCLYIGADFGLSLEQLATMLRLSEQGGRASESHQASGAVFRRTQGWISDLASGAWDAGFIRCLGHAAVERSRASRQAISQLSHALRMDEGWREWLFRSHVHLSMNRLTRNGMVNAEPLAKALAARIASTFLAKGLRELPRRARQAQPTAPC